MRTGLRETGPGKNGGSRKAARAARASGKEVTRIGIVAGEASGDILGGALMAAIRQRRPETEFVGVGGASMTAAGLRSLAPMDALAVNGFKEPLLRLPSLLRLLRRLRRHFVAAGVDAVVGVDFNVFNLLLERGVKKLGIATAHYVSPSVYFWRRGRIRRIRKAADVVLALFPFEPALYAERGGNAVFVGHPLADEIDPQDGSEAAKARARAALGVAPEQLVVALLPGSRGSEIGLLGKLFLDTALMLQQSAFGDAAFLVPTPTPRVHNAMAAVLRGHRIDETLAVRLVAGQSRQVLAAADVVLTKAGTATLEAMMLRRPMVVCYRLGAVSAWIVRRLQRSRFVALPNILAGQALVPELLQGEARPSLLAEAVQAQYARWRSDDAYRAACGHWHERLRCGGAGRAAEAVLDLIDSRGSKPHGANAAPRAG